jgi:Galactose oxidase, central domain
MALLRSFSSAALTALFTATLLGGCGSDPDPAPQEPPPPPPPQNEPPAWTDAPGSPIVLGQGQSTSLPLALTDPEGDALTVRVVVPAGVTDIEAEVAADTSAILLHAGYVTQGPLALEVEIDDGRGGITKAPLNLEIPPIRWVGSETWPANAGPEEREHGAVIVDAEGQRAFVIGGSGYMPQFAPLGDVWRYDFATSAWTEETPTGDVPAPAGSRRVAKIPGQPIAYLHGGYGEGNDNKDELYRATFDGATVDFTLLTQTNPPSARSLHMFVYDAEGDRFFMFGGYAGNVAGDTWMMTIEGNDAVWTELTPAVAPSRRYGFFYGVDEVNGRVLLYSGAQGLASVNPAQDTWALDMRSDPPAWQLLADGAKDGVPPGRRNGCGVLDPSGPRLVIFGGTADAMTTSPGLFVFDARPGKPGWTELMLADGPPLRSSGFGFHDPTTTRTLLGFGNDSSIYRDWWILGY